MDNPLSAVVIHGTANKTTTRPLASVVFLIIPDKRYAYMLQKNLV